MKLKEASDDQKLTLLQAMLAKKDLSVKDAMVFVADMLMAGIETSTNLEMRYGINRQIWKWNMKFAPNLEMVYAISHQIWKRYNELVAKPQNPCS
ncbi:hypothetical protein TNCV_3424631 [Trichonephila clavipes]|nr:hypothetical protein TNCV_3424631 [Trichonephila clavipes]